MATKVVNPKSKMWDEERYPGSVLLADQIKKWRDYGYLIVPDPFYQDVGDTFDRKQLKRSKYDVRLGKMYFKNGHYGILNTNLPETTDLVIDPYELVFVESYEVFKLPKNIIGVYDLRVKCCLGGLGLQTGLQLDPEYYGRIFCPLFNFSSEKETLKYMEQLASVRFTYTTLYTDKLKKYVSIASDKQNKFSLKQLLPDNPRQSSMVTMAKETKDLYTKTTAVIEEFNEIKTHSEIKFKTQDEKIENLNKAVTNAMAFMIMALAVVVSTVSIATTRETSGANVGLAIGLFVVICVIGGLIYLQIKNRQK